MEVNRGKHMVLTIYSIICVCVCVCACINPPLTGGVSVDIEACYLRPAVRQKQICSNKLHKIPPMRMVCVQFFYPCFFSFFTKCGVVCLRWDASVWQRVSTELHCIPLIIKPWKRRSKAQREGEAAGMWAITAAASFLVPAAAWRNLSQPQNVDVSGDHWSTAVGFFSFHWGIKLLFMKRNLDGTFFSN